MDTETQTPKKKAKKSAVKSARTHRLDMRLTKAEKAKLVAKAKAMRRTITSIIIELVEKMR